MYRLRFLGRLSDHAPLPVRQPVLTIGRAGSCHLQLLENGVSDQHAAIERREDGYYLRDLASATGVIVNGQPISQHRLQSGDELELGSVHLQFEILHDPPTRRRVFDAFQQTAVLLVVVLVAGQLAALAWIFRQPHPRPEPRPKPAPPPPSASPTPETPAMSATPAPAPPAPTPAPATPIRPATLTRMLRIERVGARVTDNRLNLLLQVQARVGERQLDPAAAAICVQFFIRNTEGRLAPWPPLWLTIPAWENFTSKTFTARFPGAVADHAGYVVRTYYRGELQDVAAQPDSLLASAPDPMVN